jgi:translation elongation factor EF-G
MVLDLGEFEQKPSNKIEGFYKRIKEHLPSLKSHRCSEGKPGGFFKRIKDGTWMGHIIEHVALELQTLAGYDTGWGRTRGVKGQKGVYNVIFNYEDEECGKLAAREAYNVVNNIINDRNPQIDKIVKKLKSKTLQESIRKVLKEESLKQTLMDEIMRSGIKDTSNLMSVDVKELLEMVGMKGTQEDMKFITKVIMENEVKEQLKYCSYDILPTQHSINIYVYIPKPLPTQSGVWVYDKKVRDDAEELVRYVLYKLGGGLIRGHNVYVYNTGDC